MKQELANFKSQKLTGNSENATTIGPLAQASNNIESGNGSVPRKDPTVLEKEVKQLQKKVRDMTAEAKSKKEKQEELDGVIKKLQERLQQKIDESANGERKIKELQDELQKAKKEASELKDQQQKQSKVNVNQFKTEIQNIIILAKKNQISYEQLCKDLKNNNSALFTVYHPAGLKEFLHSA